MTPEQQNIAIAKFSGRLYHKPTEEEIRKGSYYQYEPQFTGDLNAIHSVWHKLDTSQRAKFAEELAYIVLACYNDPKSEFVLSRCSLSIFANATASQRCEALLRTIGKWIE